MDKSKLKVALVGTGGAIPTNGFADGFTSPESWGLQYARILSLRPDIDFCAIVGRNPEKTRQKAKEWNTRFYLDVDEMLEKEKPDLVCLCLPNQEHFEATLKVIQAGFPLMVEKPFVFRLDEADILIDEARKRNLFFAINFNHRYALPVQKAKQAIHANELGELVFASWRFGGEGDGNHPFANLIETQCHGFDMLEYLCGPIESLSAEMTDKTGKGFSTMSIALKFANGAVGSLLGSYDSSYAYRQTHSLEINGTEGRILIHDTVQSYSFQKAGDETAQVWQAGYFNDVDREFARTFDKHMEEILAAFRTGRTPPVHADAGHRALLLAHAVIESYQTGKRVSVHT